MRDVRSWFSRAADKLTGTGEQQKVVNEHIAKIPTGEDQP